MIREIDVKLISEAITDMCFEANYDVSDEMKKCFTDAVEKEDNPLGKKILNQILENHKIAKEDMVPLCQDTGMAIIFMDIGQDVHFVGGDLTEAVNEGVRKGYVEGYLRKSVVSDPLIRNNTNDNTPAVLHINIVPGDKVSMMLTSKGFGSENTSKIHMLKPADGIEGVKKAIVQTVLDAGPNACPPVVVGVGVGGTFEKAALIAKRALLRDVGVHSDIEYIKNLECEVLEEINSSGIGPGGLGGRTTAFAVNIDTYATHIAGLPLAVNICCHVNRHAKRII